MSNNEKYIKIVEGAVSRRVSGILHRIEYLKRLDKYIQEEKNVYEKDKKLSRYYDEVKKLEERKREFNYFINVKMIEFFNKHNVDYSIHILEDINKIKINE